MNVFSTVSTCYLDDADGFPGEVEAGVEQEGEDECESSVPAERKTQEGSTELREQRPESAPFEPLHESKQHVQF